VLSIVIDQLIQNNIILQISELADLINPEVTDKSIAISMGLGLLVIIYFSYCLLGLFLFWNLARHIFLSGFIIFLPTHLLLGVTVSSGLSRLCYELAILLCGVTLTLIYTSPVKDYFSTKTRKKK